MRRCWEKSTASLRIGPSRIPRRLSYKQETLGSEDLPLSQRRFEQRKGIHPWRLFTALGRMVGEIRKQNRPTCSRTAPERTWLRNRLKACGIAKGNKTSRGLEATPYDKTSEAGLV